MKKTFGTGRRYLSAVLLLALLFSFSPSARASGGIGGIILEDAQIRADVSADETVVMTMSRGGDRYYAYNHEYNFCVMDARLEDLDDNLWDYILIANGGKDRTSRWIRSFCGYSSEYGHLVIEDDSGMLSFDGPDWTHGVVPDARLVLMGYWNQGGDAMRLAGAYWDVATWYSDTFGWHGLCNDGTENALVIIDNPELVAANADSIIIFADPSVYDSEEVLAHEFFHSVFKIKTGTPAPTGQAKALNEGLSDAFAALFQESVLGHDDWVIGRNVSGAKNLSRAETTRGGEVTSWPRTMDGYITKTDKDYCHQNSGIISYTLYNIWDQVFCRDSAMFGQVLFRSLDYMPSDTDFSDFREAFETAMDIWYSDEMVAQAMEHFDIAKIPPRGENPFTQALDPVLEIVEENLRIPGRGFPATLLDLAKLNYGQLSHLNWSGGLYTDWVGGTGKGSWVLAANFADENMDLMFNFSFDGELEDESQYPVSIYVSDFKDGQSGYSLDGHNAIGMTPSEFGDKDPAQMMSVPYLNKQGYIELPMDDGWLLTAYFTDPGDRYGSASILTAAELMRAW